MRTLSKDHSPHVTDERFNTASHLVALVFALVGGAWLIVEASFTGDPWRITTVSIYVASLVLLFLGSTLHHGLDGSPAFERTLRTLDYVAIFGLIGGTMTPICLALLGTPLAWVIFGGVWGVGLAGAALRASRPDLPKWVTGTLYGALGALGVALVWPVWEIAGLAGVSWIALGGALYTAGSAVFALERPNLWPGVFGFHEIWHLFVIGGAAAHFVFIAAWVV